MLTNETWDHQYREKKSHVTACNMPLTCIKNTSCLKIDHWGTSQDADAGWGKLFSKLTKNDLLDKQNLNQFTACFGKPIAYNFCKNMSSSILLKAFRRSTRMKSGRLPPSKINPQLELGLRLRLGLVLGLEGNFPRRQLS